MNHRFMCVCFFFSQKINDLVTVCFTIYDGVMSRVFEKCFDDGFGSSKFRSIAKGKICLSALCPLRGAFTIDTYT